MSQPIVVVKNSTPLLGILTIVFVVLKLCGVINWSWWWVLCPAWIPLAVVIVILLVLLLIWIATNIR